MKNNFFVDIIKCFLKEKKSVYIYQYFKAPLDDLFLGLPLPTIVKNSRSCGSTCFIIMQAPT